MVLLELPAGVFLPERFGRLGTISQFLQILIQAISQHHTVFRVMSAWINDCILTSQLLNSISIALESSIGHYLLPLHLPLYLPLKSIFLQLLLFPLFICNTSHYALVGLCLLFAILFILLLLVAELFINRFIPLLQQRLLQPLFEHSICRILLCMLAESIKFLLLILLISPAFLFKAFLILPLHHPVMLLLSAKLFGCLSLAHLLKNIALFFSYQLFFELGLMLLASHPFFMGDGCGTTFTNLATLLD